MSPTRLEDLIAAGETLGVEFKNDVNDTELVEAVVCLANGGGGILLGGVEDDGTVRGARNRHGSATDPRRVEALVSNSTRPAIGARAEVDLLRKLKDVGRLKLVKSGRNSHYVGMRVHGPR